MAKKSTAKRSDGRRAKTKVNSGQGDRGDK